MSLSDMIAKQKAAQMAKAENPATPPSPAVEAATIKATPTAGVVKGLRFGKAIAKSIAEEPKAATIPTIAEATTVEDSVMTLDDLAETTDEGLEPATHSSGYEDEIPCTAPERDLPADLTESQKQFVAQLNGIYEIVHDPELFGQMISTIMQEMQENPDYVNLMADQDVHTMIRGLRESMGLAKIKKAEKSTKSRAGKAAPKTAAFVDTLDEMFNADDF